MQISVVNREPDFAGNACRIVGIHAGSALRGGARALDRAADGALSRVIERGDFDASVGDTLLLHELSGATSERVMLVGLGKRGALERASFSKVAEATASALLGTATRDASSDLAAVAADADGGLEPAWLAARLARAVGTAAYRFDGHARREPPEPPRLENLVLVVPRAACEEAERDVTRAVATAAGMNRARALGDLAPNLCTPRHLADTALAMAAEDDRLECTIVEESEMEELGMGAFLSVTRGSEQPARLIAMSWRGAQRRVSPVVVLGKGITFDTGGISIKPSASLDEMKYDMCGAAAVFGVIEACRLLKLPIDVTGVVAAAENMPDGSAARPGDVVTSMSGQTIEILNTDAEGRMVLCDALSWIERLKPKAVIDVATLTGACVVALGDVASGLFGNDERLIEALLDAGREADDPAWQLPLLPAYQKQLDSNFADMANIGGKGAGAITAACFLSRFAEAYDWAHLDVAGTASRSGKDKGATGRPVPLLMNYLFAQLAR